jgi:hypothetical protein
MNPAMETINTHALQERLKKEQSLALSPSVGSVAVPTSELFQKIKEMVTALYADYPHVLRFVIQSNAKVESPYCFTITRKSVAYMTGGDDLKKTITCDLEKEAFFINKNPVLPGFESKFQKYISRAFKDIQEKKATLYEEAVEKV